MASRTDVKNRLRIAAEDRFLFIKLREDKALLPEGGILETFSDTLRLLSSSYSILCDWRGLEHVTNDVIEALNSLCSNCGARIIATSKEAADIRTTFRKPPPVLQIRKDLHMLDYAAIDLGLFDFEDDDDIKNYDFEKFLDDALTEEEYRRGPVDDVLDKFWDFRLHDRRAYLEGVIHEIGRNSILSEFVMQMGNDEILLTPYHSHASYQIELREQLVIGKPGVIAEKTGALLQPEITGFEQVISKPRIQESEIQTFLEQHPNILKALSHGYTRLYSQVVLHREDGTSLRPDFILEPVGSSWCDILDIKLPDNEMVVGRRDRKTFSAAVHELAAQLREYAAYFEDPRLQKRVEEVYGIKCYKPRLIGIIGHDPRLEDERQLRRVETLYSDIEILTFERLLAIAKSRPLI